MSNRTNYIKLPLRNIDEFITSKKSMLRGELPFDYSKYEDQSSIEDTAYPKEDRHVRLFIIWDTPIRDIPVDDVLSKLRETGAAMVWKVEPVS